MVAVRELSPSGLIHENPDRRVTSAERQALKDSLAKLDEFAREATQGQTVYFLGRETNPGFIHFISKDEPDFLTPSLMLNSREGFKPWDKVCGISGVADKVGYYRGEYFGQLSGKGKDIFFAWRDINDRVVRHFVKYKGENFHKRKNLAEPAPRWNELKQRDWAVASALVEQALAAVQAYREGKTELKFS